MGWFTINLPKNLFSLSKKLTNLMVKYLTAGYDYHDALKFSLTMIRKIYDYANNNGKPIYLMFSGGKDSLVLLDLVCSAVPARNVKVIFIEVTGNTHDKNIQYVYRIVLNHYKVPMKNFIHLLNRKYDFFERVTKWGWPHIRRLWCMNVFKRYIIAKFFKNSYPNEPPLVFVGTKISDSPLRKKRLLVNGPICLLRNCPFIMNRQYYTRLKILYPSWFKKILVAEKLVKKGAPFLIGKKKIYLKELILNPKDKT